MKTNRVFCQLQSSFGVRKYRFCFFNIAGVFKVWFSQVSCNCQETGCSEAWYVLESEPLGSFIYYLFYLILGQFLSMGYGFVEFKTEKSAKEALKKLQVCMYVIVLLAN